MRNRLGLTSLHTNSVIPREPDGDMVVGDILVQVNPLEGNNK